MKNKIKILYLDILTGDPDMKREIEKKIYKSSTYSEATRKAFSLDKSEWMVCDAALGWFPEDVKSFDGVVIGGSTEDPIKGQEKPWMKDTYVFIKKIIKSGVPILGICGGLQFTVRALGGELILNPKGKEQGTKQINLTIRGTHDHLFGGLHSKLFVQLSHKVMAGKLKRGWGLLASSKLCGVQTLAIGDNIRLTQFHPEMTAGELKSIIKMRKDKLITEGFIKNEEEFKKFLSSIKDTGKTNKQILKNFLTYFVIPHAAKRVDK